MLKWFTVLSEIVGPSNTAVLAGDKMNMNCTTTNNSFVRKWTVYMTNRATSTILQGFPWKLRGDFTHFRVDTNDNGSATISTNSTRLNDAGVYRCHCETDGKDTEYSAHLIVLGRNIRFMVENNMPYKYFFDICYSYYHHYCC